MFVKTFSLFGVVNIVDQVVSKSEEKTTRLGNQYAEYITVTGYCVLKNYNIT